MRVFYGLILLIIAAAVGLFAWQNHEPLTLRYFDRSLTTNLAVLIASVYFLGMLSGWTVIGFLKRSVQKVTERRAD